MEQEADRLWDSYFYPETNVLINNFGYKNQEELRKAEASYSFDRLLELRNKPLDMNFDKQHLREIHRYIFREIYPFAGEYRKVNLAKERGSFLFIRNPQDIDIYLTELFNTIHTQLQNCNVKYQFSDFLSKLYTSLIYCHPFREGNGRSIREFVREFSIVKSKELGLGELELDWKLIDKTELNKYIEVAHLFPGATTILFNNALVPVSSKSNDFNNMIK